MTDQHELRLRPGLAFAALLLSGRFGIALAYPGFEGFRIAFFVGLFSSLAIFVWWTFASRAPRVERWGAMLLIFIGLLLTWRLNHPSMGLIWCLSYAVPWLSLALVTWAVAGQRLAERPRRVALAGVILLACGGWTLVRSEGMTGDHTMHFAWRWAATAEERLLAEGDDWTKRPTEVAPATPGVSIAGPAGWPGFRGPGRDSLIRGNRLATDWSSTPPIELWRRPIGPGWSSFAVRGDRLYTQEQRGDDEVVACYDATTGEPVWSHRDKARFFEAMGGAGPRATPNLDNNHVYTLGGTGLANALDATDGTRVWSRDTLADTGVRVPVFGIASSPLVAGDLVLYGVSGRLIAYDRATGEPRWLAPAGGASYSSPHRVVLDGVEQILLQSGAGAISVEPADGTVLWQSLWKGQPLVQPAVTADSDVLIAAGEGYGVRRLAITQSPDGWTAEERWTSNRLKPNFNDFVIHHGHAFGFDGHILACIDLEDGARRWKGGRYGQGQLVLLADQDLLLVLSEKGELALVEASAEGFTERARFPALEGKTWNHPVLIGDRLWVRNGQEMAAFRLPLSDQ
ncbi:MAG: PQQ-binding-like beta-propeller repeat protein [Acidobacteriota bacterium]